MTEPLLVLDGLQKSFGALRATDDVSLSVDAGSIHALIGPNGAGKSTLIGQIAGALRPDAGKIAFMARDVTGLSVPQRAQLGLGRTFQVSSLAMEFSALRNVMLAVQARKRSTFRFWRPVRGDRDLTDPAMLQLERVGLAERAQLPVTALSHGERRQLELAVALALEPKVLLLDEPMAGLGGEDSQRMTEVLGNLRQEAAMLLVEHDMDAVFTLADEISVLVYGRIIASGSVADIRASQEVRDAYLGE
ncbi:ABC transporter ATP-binding protein [Pelagibius sp. Alg239-R121]|uniref:ABC transporter ATP-binding protein n=1 Tax=Pelagibius sp. Alg239-R121 TaxID=2993448 RepID=UPI0024A68E5C|nr:ABC transporter ATP-binding protein [Pelagibius sp. Alg239-R121]